MREVVELNIGRVGAQGDGIAEYNGRQVFVPLTLAGETVQADVSGERAHLLKVVSASGDRIAPVCRHFGICGGCSLQHMRPAAYDDWKRQQVAAAFAARGIDADVANLVSPGGARRRAVFAAERGGDQVKLGFHLAQSHDVIDLEECPVIEPKIANAMPVIRDFLAALMARKTSARVTVTLTIAGIDIHVEATTLKLIPDLRTRIARLASSAGLVRIAINDEVVFEALSPFLLFGDVDVVLPPRVFIQAVGAAELAMARLVTDAVGKSKRVADLFSGAGAFTFPLARRARVAAFDSDRNAILALIAASKKASGIKPVLATVRDLFREPLSGTELNEHDAIVFDPPRAGADAQARMIAKSKVPVVVAVSCNPATLARDARTLIDGGYNLGSVVPVDQFHFSPHVEAVAVFRR